MKTMLIRTDGLYFYVTRNTNKSERKTDARTYFEKYGEMLTGFFSAKSALWGTTYELNEANSATMENAKV